jgi:hypothetical protein
VGLCSPCFPAVLERCALFAPFSAGVPLVICWLRNRLLPPFGRRCSGGAEATPSKIQRTDRFGFIIPEGYNQRPGSNSHLTSRESQRSVDTEVATPASEPSSHLLRDGAGSRPGSGGDGPSMADGASTAKSDVPERPYDGPPPSSPYGGVIPRHTLSASAVSDKEKKQLRAHLRLENLRIKKWMDMFAKWDEYVVAALPRVFANRVLPAPRSAARDLPHVSSAGRLCLTVAAPIFRFVRKNPKKLKSRCRKGIPDAVRGRAWMLLTDSFRRKAQFSGHICDEPPTVPSRL